VAVEATGLGPRQPPAAQPSLCVQALPSLHGAVLLVWTPPVAGLQESLVHGLPSSQLGAAPPTQMPPLQVSLVVQALPSLQALPLVFWGLEQTPVVVLQVPAVWH